MKMLIPNHSWIGLREQVGLARWVEANYVTAGFVVDVVAAATWAVGNSGVFGTVAAVVEFVFVVVVPDTAEFVVVA